MGFLVFLQSCLLMTPEDLAVLPADWLASFRQAALALDVDLLLNLIAQIHEQHEYIANALAELVNKYKFEEL